MGCCVLGVVEMNHNKALAKNLSAMMLLDLP